MSDEVEEKNEDQDSSVRQNVPPRHDTSGYVGVDPEYRNYANETEKPYLTDEEQEFLNEHGLQTDQQKVDADMANYLFGQSDTEDEDDDDEDDEDSEGNSTRVRDANGRFVPRNKSTSSVTDGSTATPDASANDEKSNDLFR